MFPWCAAVERPVRRAIRPRNGAMIAPVPDRTIACPGVSWVRARGHRQHDRRMADKGPRGAAVGGRVVSMVYAAISREVRVLHLAASCFTRAFSLADAMLRCSSHDQRRRFPRPTSRIRSSGKQAARPLHRTGARRLAHIKTGAGVSRSGRIVPGNRSRFGKGAARQHPGEPPDHRTLAGRYRQGARRAPNGRSAARPLISIIFAAGRDPGRERLACSVLAATTADGRALQSRCEGDRHHFRFIVSPDDAAE